MTSVTDKPKRAYKPPPPPRFRRDEIALALVMVWTVVGLVLWPFGIHVGWWDWLSSMGFFNGDNGWWFPPNPRYA